MTTVRLSIVAALAAVVLTGAAEYRVTLSRNAEAARLASANAELRSTVLRAHAAEAKAPARAPVSLEGAARPVSIDQPSSASSDYRNEGNATAAAALQTVAWAGDRGDHDTLRRLLVYEPAARRKMEAYWNGLSPKVREETGTPENMAALELAHDMMEHPFPRAELMARMQPTSVTADRVHFDARQGTDFQQTSEGWKLVVPESVVDAYIAEHTSQ